jgi:hypothetical protein
MAKRKKPFILTGTVLIMDGKPDKTGTIHMPGSVVIPKEWVPVTMQYDNRNMVGMAELVDKGKKIDAKIHVFGELPLGLTPKVLRLSEPAIAGQIIERNPGNEHVVKCKITSIGLFPPGSNVDKRIKRLK